MSNRAPRPSACRGRRMPPDYSLRPPFVRLQSASNSPGCQFPHEMVRQKIWKPALTGIVRLATYSAFARSAGGYFPAKGATPLQCQQAGRDQAAQRAEWDATAEPVLDIRRPHFRLPVDPDDGDSVTRAYCCCSVGRMRISLIATCRGRVTM